MRAECRYCYVPFVLTLLFDRSLFEMGFSDQLHEILKRVAAERQTLLFSATMPKMLVR